MFCVSLACDHTMKDRAVDAGLMHLRCRSESRVYGVPRTLATVVRYSRWASLVRQHGESNWLMIPSRLALPSLWMFYVITEYQENLPKNFLRCTVSACILRATYAPTHLRPVHKYCGFLEKKIHSTKTTTLFNENVFKCFHVHSSLNLSILNTVDKGYVRLGQ